MRHARWSVFAACWLVLPLVSATAREEEPAPQSGVHLEVPNDPYIPGDREGQRLSPAARITRGGNVSVQVNVGDLGGVPYNIVGDAANEPSIAVDPVNPNRMAIGWRQFDSIESDFRQAGWGYTDDGGLTWTFPGVIEPGVFRSDPVLASDAAGNFYYNSLTASANLTEFWCSVYKSTDGGVSWDAGVYAYGGDKQWMAIDQSGGIGDGNIYAFWSRAYTCPGCPGHFTWSYDRGATFQETINVIGNPYYGTLMVGPDGELYVAGSGMVVTKSTTLKDPLLPAAWDFTTNVNLDGSLQGHGGPNPGGLLGQVWIDVDRSNGPTRGNVYILASVSRNSISDPQDVMFARSTDGGTTWSNPVRVNDDPEDNGAYQWFGTMSVAPNGRIDVVWNDTRNDPGGYLSELYYSYSVDAGVTWAPSVPLTPQYDPHVGWPQQNKMGDYYHMVSDDEAANLAFAATFNGEQDVYFMRIRRFLALGLASDLPELVAPGETADVTVRILPGSETLVGSAPAMHYRLDNGVFQIVELVPLGGELYQATLPAAACGDTPEFYFSAEGSDSGVVTLPANAPADVFTFEVGSLLFLMQDDFETDTGWTVEDSAGLEEGTWERGVPVDNDRGDPPADYDGSGQCYLTENDPADPNSDVDGGYTWLISPTIDLSEGDATVNFALWYTNNAGSNPNSDTFVAYLSNDDGQTWVEAATYGPATSSGWVVRSLPVSDTVTPTAQVKLRLEASDLGSGSVVEAGVDAFAVTRVMCEDLLGDGDFDLDGDVDLFDFSRFQLCFEQSSTGECQPGNLAGGGVIGLGDFSAFVSAMTGPQ